MTYILENKSEARRLQVQNTRPQYDIGLELSYLKKSISGKKVLDAGCGVGTLATILENDYHCKVDACDTSELRIAEAKKLPNAKSINFFVADLTKLSIADDTYDIIFVRYVLEHTLYPVPILRELKRILKANGRLIVIDVDGLIFDVHHENEELTGYLKALEKDLPVDLKIGRKLPRLFVEQGFTVSELHIQSLQFRGEELDFELENMVRRFSQCRAAVEEILGSEKYDRFLSLFLEEMRLSHIVVTQKFIIEGLKEKS